MIEASVYQKTQFETTVLFESQLVPLHIGGCPFLSPPPNLSVINGPDGQVGVLKEGKCGQWVAVPVCHYTQRHRA